MTGNIKLALKWQCTTLRTYHTQN